MHTQAQSSHVGFKKKNVFMQSVKRFAKGFADIIYPALCVSCKKKLTASSIDNIICLECWRKIQKHTPPFCHRCGRRLMPPFITKHICLGCLKKELHFDRSVSACAYDGIIKKLLHDFKYNGKDYFGATLSKLMIDFIREYDVPMDFFDCIMPIPLHHTKLREREFNQSQILGSHIATTFNKKLETSSLIRHRNTKTQTELPPQERHLNVKGSFSVADKNAVKNRHILLIDDVLTTGATASEAASTLKEAGAGVVFLLTLAS